MQSDIFFRDNMALTKNLVTRAESGFLQTLSELLQSVAFNNFLGSSSKTELDNSFTRLESIFLKLSTAPLIPYDTLSYDLLSDLILSTEPVYHKRLANLLIDSMVAIYAQKKLGRAEDFKTKISMKFGNLVGIICQLSEEV